MTSKRIVGNTGQVSRARRHGAVNKRGSGRPSTCIIYLDSTHAHLKERAREHRAQSANSFNVWSSILAKCQQSVGCLWAPGQGNDKA
jgi:hypothetical protein